MEGKLGELHFDIEALADPFNTHGTEIAPRSYVVREDLEHLCRHGGKLSLARRGPPSYTAASAGTSSSSAAREGQAVQQIEHNRCALEIDAQIPLEPHNDTHMRHAGSGKLPGRRVLPLGIQNSLFDQGEDDLLFQAANPAKLLQGEATLFIEHRTAQHRNHFVRHIVLNP